MLPQLMGAIQGLFLAQYKVLRKNGHTPSEAFNETVEEATQSLYPLVGQYGYVFIVLRCVYPRLREHYQYGLHVQRMLDHCPPRCFGLG